MNEVRHVPFVTGQKIRGPLENTPGPIFTTAPPVPFTSSTTCSRARLRYVNAYVRAGQRIHS